MKKHTFCYIKDDKSYDSLTMIQIRNLFKEVDKSGVTGHFMPNFNESYQYSVPWARFGQNQKRIEIWWLHADMSKSFLVS